MDPKADKLKENVSLNFRHLKVTTKQKYMFRFNCIISLEKFTKLNMLCSQQVAGVERLCVFWSGFSDKK